MALGSSCRIASSTQSGESVFTGLEPLESRQMLSAVPAPLAGITNPANDHTYYLLPRQTWAQAEAHAIRLGGHLATVRNLAEHQWLWNTFSPAANVLWIGINDVAQDGQFVWSSGEAVTYTNWGSMEPNNDWTGEMWGSLWNFYAGGGWNDLGPSSPEGTSQFGIAEVFTPPDLSVQLGRISGVITCGGTVPVRTYVINSGPGNAPATQVRYFLSANNTLDRYDLPLGKSVAPAVGARQVNVFRGGVPIPAGTKSGTWYLIAQADSSRLLVESNETNNTSIAAPIRIGCSAVAPLAASWYELALGKAVAEPDVNLGTAAQFIARHETVVPYVYPDANGQPAVGVKFGLQQSSPAAVQAVVDGALGAGTYQRMMASWEKTCAAWTKIYGRRNWQYFKFDSSRHSVWRNFEKLAPALGGLEKVVTLDREAGGRGTATILLEQSLPALTRQARNILGRNRSGGWVYYTLSSKAQGAVLDLVFARGTEFQTMTGFIDALRNGNVARAAFELMNAPRMTSGPFAGLTWAQAAQDRAVDEFRYLAAGHESELVSYGA